MLTYANIYAAIAEYDHNKGWVSVFLEPAHIKGLRTYARDYMSPLSAADCVAVGKIILECQVSPTQTSFRTIERLKERLPSYVTILHENGLLSNDNLEMVFAHQFRSQIESIIWALDQAKLLNKDSLNAICTYSPTPIYLADTLVTMVRANLLNARTFTDVIAHRDIIGPLKTFNLLAKANLLTLDILTVVLQYDSSFWFLNEALEKLQAAYLLTPSYLASILQHRRPSDLASALILSHRHPKLIAADELDLIVKSDSPLSLVNILIKIENINAFTPDHRYQLLTHKSHYTLEMAIKTIQEANLLTTENITVTLTHPQPSYIARTLATLQHANILTAENRASIAAAGNIEQLSELLRRLDTLNILTQVNFNRLAKNPAFVESLSLRQLAHIPQHQFTQIVFDTLFTLYEQANGDVAAAVNRMNQYIDRDILGINNANNQGINAAQSTHTASVHKTVSKSATALKQTYSTVIGHQIDILLRQILAWSKTLDTSCSSTENSTQIALQRAAAQRAIVRICGNDSLYGSYTDHISQVSTRQLLALIWRGIHDEHNRQGSLEDALQRLIDGLYEIQRGYNLDARGKEINLNQDDLPICTAGTFNKLIEKMVGVLPQASIQMITKELASQKFPRMVSEVLIDYLTSHPARKKIIDAIEAEDISVVWAEIKKIIADKMFEEFGSLYQSKTDPEFINLIESGIYVPIDEALLAKLKVSSPSTDPSVTTTSSSLFHQSSSSSSTSSTSISHASDDPDANTKADMVRPQGI